MSETFEVVTRQYIEALADTIGRLDDERARIGGRLVELEHALGNSGNDSLRRDVTKVLEERYYKPILDMANALNHS